MSQLSYGINQNKAMLGMVADARYTETQSKTAFEAIQVGLGIVKVKGKDDQARLPKANNPVLSFDADFESGDTIDLKINGTSITQVDFDTDQATTMAALATELALNADVLSATVTDTREITMVAVEGKDIILSEIVIGGTTAPTATYTTGTSDKLLAIARRTQALEGGLPGEDVEPSCPVNSQINALTKGPIYVYFETAFDPDTDTLYCRFEQNGAGKIPGQFTKTDDGKVFAVSGNFVVEETLTEAGIGILNLNKPV